MKDQILAEIRRLTLETGRSPGQIAFRTATGIPPTRWMGVYWARWSEALAEAGCEPNERQTRLPSSEILSKVANACRHYGSFPSSPELRLYKRNVDETFPSHSTIDNHFRGRIGLLNALSQFVATNTDFSDVAAVLPEPGIKTERSSAPEQEGYVYLLKWGNHYKIGRSDEIERRVKEIKNFLPENGELVHSIRTDDPVGIEAYWHRRFSEFRANGEWFRLGPKELKAFRRRVYQ